MLHPKTQAALLGLQKILEDRQISPMEDQYTFFEDWAKKDGRSEVACIKTLITLKLTRLDYGKSEVDSLLDICGYALLGAAMLMNPPSPFDDEPFSGIHEASCGSPEDPRVRAQTSSTPYIPQREEIETQYISQNGEKYYFVKTIDGVRDIFVAHKIHTDPLAKENTGKSKVELLDILAEQMDLDGLPGRPF